MSELPYITRVEYVIVREYNPKYGKDRMCQCGHPYYRHFDTYEDMRDVGCKYSGTCGCCDFEEAGPYSPIAYDYFAGSDRV